MSVKEFDLIFGEAILIPVFDACGPFENFGDRTVMSGEICDHFLSTVRCAMFVAHDSYYYSAPLGAQHVEHFAPTELRVSAGVKAINITLLTELQTSCLQQFTSPIRALPALPAPRSE